MPKSEPPSVAWLVCCNPRLVGTGRLGCGRLMAVGRDRGKRIPAAPHRVPSGEVEEDGAALDNASQAEPQPRGGGDAVRGKPQWLPLDATLREALLALPRHGRRVFRFTDRGGRSVNDLAVSHRVVKLAKLAGVTLTMRTLRKGFGCYYAARVPAQVLQKLMRHADIKTTMAYYANVDDAVEAAVAARNGPRASPLSEQEAVP